jgi:hypothetical protein
MPPQTQPDTERVRLKGPDGKAYSIPSHQAGAFLRTHPDYDVAPPNVPIPAGGTIPSGLAGEQRKLSDMTRIPPSTAVISSGPHGTDAVKAALYKMRNAGINNLDAAGGITGGLLGASGGPPGAIAGSALGGGAGRALTQLIHTFMGKPMASSADAAKDIGMGAAVQGVSEGFGQAIGGVSRIMKPASREALLAYGTRSGEMGPEIKGLLPDLDKVASRVGSPKSASGVADMEQLVHATERSLNQEFNTALFPIAQQPVVAHSVGQAIRGEITPNMVKTVDGRKMAAYLRRRATEFEQGTWTIAELNKERELITKRLTAYHKAIPTAQSASEKIHANIAADTAAEDSLKDLLYSAADQSGIKPPGYFKALKQKQSQLITFQDSIKAAKKDLTKASMERQGAPLSEKVHLRTYLHPKSGTPGGVAGLSPSAFTDPLERSSERIAKAFPKGAQATKRALRTGAAKVTSVPAVNALPLRAVMGDYSEEAPQ